jgi:hypothetical protein
MSFRNRFGACLIVAVAFILSCAAANQPEVQRGQSMVGVGPADKIQLPPPFATPSARNTSKVIGWPKGKMPTPAPGFEVSLFAENFDNPRST